MTSAAGTFGASAAEVVSGAGSSLGRAVEEPDHGDPVIRREVRIAERRRQRLVPHQLLHAPDVGATHQQPRAEGVPEVVPPEVVDASAPQRWLEDSVVEVLGVEGCLTGGA